MNRLTLFFMIFVWSSTNLIAVKKGQTVTAEELAEKKRKLLEKQVEYPKDPAISYNLGVISFKEQHYAEAEQHFQHAVNDMTDDKPLSLRKRSYANLAMSIYHAVLHELGPNWRSQKIEREKKAVALKRLEGALQHCENAATLEKENEREIKIKQMIEQLIKQLQDDLKRQHKNSQNKSNKQDQINQENSSDDLDQGANGDKNQQGQEKKQLKKGKNDRSSLHEDGDEDHEDQSMEEQESLDKRDPEDKEGEKGENNGSKTKKNAFDQRDDNRKTYNETVDNVSREQSGSNDNQQNNEEKKISQEELIKGNKDEGQGATKDLVKKTLSLAEVMEQKTKAALQALADKQARNQMDMIKRKMLEQEYKRGACFNHMKSW